MATSLPIYPLLSILMSPKPKSIEKSAFIQFNGLLSLF
jgi:hypothetical protein